MSSITTATLVANGDSHACALLGSSSARCWGLNTESQIGNGTTSNAVNPPVDVTCLVGAVVDPGRDHTCALLDVGTVQCWGGNDLAQLGNGAVASSNVPGEVPGLTNVATGRNGTLSAGASHACAILSSGDATCWGSNEQGKLRDGSILSSSRPIAVLSLPAL